MKMEPPRNFREAGLAVDLEREVFCRRFMNLRGLSFLWLAGLVFFMAGAPTAFAAKAARAKITLQPASQSIEWGGNVEFRVSYNTPSASALQWRRNGEPIANATGSSYSLAGVTAAQAGKYDVVIKNAGGSVTSKAAILTVPLAPASLVQGSAIYADLRYRVAGGTETSTGSFLVTGTQSLLDPEATTDTYSFIYKRVNPTKSTLTIMGSIYDSDLGARVAVSETYQLTFTTVNSAGEREARSSGKGAYTLPRGYKPSKLAFSSSGTLSFDPSPSPSPSPVTPDGGITAPVVAPQPTPIGGVGSSPDVVIIVSPSQ
jgi:hypothetical protein